MPGGTRGPGTRARPRLLAEGERDVLSESELPSSSSSDAGSAEPAARSRGGIRGVLVTKPPHITSCVGKGGENITLGANYLRLMTTVENAVYHTYHLEFEPNVESSRLRRGLIHSQAALFDSAYVFDGMFDLKTTQLIETPHEFVVTRNDNGQSVTITLKHVGECGPTSYEMLRFYNTQMRRNLAHLGLDLIGRYFYEKRPAVVLPDFGGITIFRGFLTAVNIHDSGALCVLDTIYKFVRSQTLYNYMREQTDQTDPEWRKKLSSDVSGLIVLTKYNNKTYRVGSVDWSSNPQSTFERRGQEISFAQYYRDAYQIEINDLEQPLVIGQGTERDSRTGEKPQNVLLIPELCNITGLADKMRANHDFMKSVARVCKMPPGERIKQLNNFISKFNQDPNVVGEMNKWNLTIQEETVKVKGRILENEKVILGDGFTAPIVNADFQRTLRGKSLYQAVSFTRWCMVFMKREGTLAEEFRDTLRKVAAPMGIEMSSPKPFFVEDDKALSFMKQVYSVPDEAQLVVIMVPNNNKDRYDNIKQYLCTKKPIPSQVVISRTLQKRGGMLSICTKIAIQIACKAGAEAWSIDIPPKKMMVVGFDTYHDSSVKGRSAGGFVSSTNQTLTKFFSQIVFHYNKEEMSSNFASCLAKAIKTYVKINNELPDRVMIYRDGVGEGMIQYVYEHELDLCRKAIARVCEGKQINLTYTIVTKRINARFFGRSGGGYTNPPPGTIIDNGVTRKERYDFYLVSQTVNEGTVAPTMFDIIWDESNWSPTNQQKLAYKLTHLYYNWSGTVKVPAPCQYAHKLAFLSGQTLHQEVEETLRDKLYFL